MNQLNENSLSIDIFRNRFKTVRKKKGDNIGNKQFKLVILSFLFVNQFKNQLLSAYIEYQHYLCDLICNVGNTIKKMANGIDHKW